MKTNFGSAYKISSDGESGTLSYDLRQRYAKLVADHIDDVAEARKTDNYYLYFKNCHDLFIVIGSRFNGDEKERYKALRNAVAVLGMKYPAVWSGKSRQSIPCQEFEHGLNQIESFLWDMINKYNFIGMSHDDAGL